MGEQLSIRSCAVCINPDLDAGAVFSRRVISTLLSRGIGVNVERRFNYYIGELKNDVYLCNSLDDAITRSDVIIVLGGDGTMLEVCEKAAPHAKPLLGINLGHLGFLTTIERERIDDIVLLTEGKFDIDERIMMDVTVRDNAISCRATALNEVTIMSRTPAVISSFYLDCDGGHVLDMSADGVIVSTPTGSTAYSMSAGGPIIDPSTDVFCFTPMCAHALGSRPMIFSGSSALSISARARDGSDGAVAIVDGRSRMDLSNKAVVTVSKSNLTARFIRFGENRFYDIVNTKLYK